MTTKGPGVAYALACLISAGALTAAPAHQDELPVDAAQVSALLKAAGSGFHLKRTPHFLVAYDAEQDRLEEFSSRIESTYRSVYRFCELGNIPAHRPQRRLEMVFFKSRHGYQQYLTPLAFPSAGTYGVYYEPQNRSAFFDVTTEPQLAQLHADIAAARASLTRLTDALDKIKGSSTPVQIQYMDGHVSTLTRSQAEKEVEGARKRLNSLDAQRATYSERINSTVLQHETAHQVLFNAGVHVRGSSNPKWLVEGLACLFEPPPDSSGTGINTINQLRLADFREAVAGPRHDGVALTSADRGAAGPAAQAGKGSHRTLSSTDFLEAIEAGRFTRPQKLVAQSRVFDERGERGTANYAEAWSLAHYLQRVHRAKLAAYIKEAAARPVGTLVPPTDELALFEKHFGRLDEAFCRRWGEYILNIGVRGPG